MASPQNLYEGYQAATAYRQSQEMGALTLREKQQSVEQEQIKLNEAKRYQQYQMSRLQGQGQSQGQPPAQQNQGQVTTGQTQGQPQTGQPDQTQQKHDLLTRMEQMANDTMDRAVDESKNGFSVQSAASMEKAQKMMTAISQGRHVLAQADEQNMKADLDKAKWLSGQMEVVKSYSPELRAQAFEQVKRDYESKGKPLPESIAKAPYSDKLLESIQNAAMERKDALGKKLEESRVNSENQHRAMQNKLIEQQTAKAKADNEVAQVQRDAVKKNNGPLGKEAVVGLTGDAYLKTLSPADAANVKYFAEGRGQLTELSSRMVKGMGKSERDRIAEMVKIYDPKFTSADAKEAVATKIAFDKGQQGNKVRSLNVAINHLDTLGELHEALKSGDVQRINQAKNFFKKEFGAEAPTNYAAAADLIADEVVSAIVPGTGSLADRESAKEKVKAELSNGQAKGVVETYHKLLGGQLSGLAQQYKAGTKASESDFREKYLTGRSKELFGKDGASSQTHEDTQAVAWAKANPNDPRAKKIMEHNGGL